MKVKWYWKTTTLLLGLEAALVFLVIVIMHKEERAWQKYLSDHHCYTVQTVINPDGAHGAAYVCEFK